MYENKEGKGLSCFVISHNFSLVGLTRLSPLYDAIMLGIDESLSVMLHLFTMFNQ